MKVSHFNTFPYGGAAVAARRISRQLQRVGVDSRFYYHRWDDETPPPKGKTESIEKAPVLENAPRNSLPLLARHREKKRLRSIWKQHNEHLALRSGEVETFSMARLPEKSHLNWQQIGAAVAHLHWMAFFLDYPSFFASIPEEVPIVWTLHDQNAFTGGCHYASGCTQFKTGCGNCPQINNANRRDVSYDSFATKKRTLARRKVHVVAPCNWMLDLAKQSPIWPQAASFHRIRYGFNLKKFYPVDRDHARKQLGIRSDAFLIGFGADDVRNRRKGVGYLLEAFNQLSTDQDVEAIMFGAGEIEPTEKVKTIHQLGFVDSLDRQRLVYSAADVIIVPSTEDNQPQVGLEAMACGTPVVGFNTCGIPEMIEHRKTGLLAAAEDSADLARQISWIINNPLQRRQMGIEARLWMEQNCDANVQAHRYVQLYENATHFHRRLKSA